MNSKTKITIYTIIGVVFLVGLVSGGTYAYFSSVVASNTNSIDTNTKKYEVITEGGTAIEGALSLTTSKEGGISSTVKLKMAEGSALPKASVFLDISSITNNLLENGDPWQKALKWEIYAYDSGNNLMASATGNFLKCGANGNTKCEDNGKLYLLKGQQLAYTDTTYVVYIWLDAAIADNGVASASLKGSIGSETEQYTGKVN